MDPHTLCIRVCHLLCLSLQVVWGLDQVTLLNPPEQPVPDHRIQIQYSCDHPATLRLDCIVSFDTGVTSTLLLRRWRCTPADRRVRTVRLNLPDWLVYRPDGIVSDSHWVLSCILRADIRYRGSDEVKGSIAAQDSANLQPKPPFSRPFKLHKLCIAWSFRMLRLTRGFMRRQCPLEKETVPLLSSLYASTGEKFGITKTLVPFGNEVLESQRVKSIFFPWCLFSLWVFVTRHCTDSMCGVLYHIDSNDNYATPSLFLTNSGQLHIQVNGRYGESSAFLSPFKVPLSEWCQISVMLQGRTVTLSMACVDGVQGVVQSTEHVLRYTVKLDDTVGYFVIGGGKFISGVAGYFGPVVFYRNSVSPDSMSDAVVPDVIKTVNLIGWLRACQEFRLDLNLKINGYFLKAQQSTKSVVCVDAVYKWARKDSGSRSSQCEQWEATIRRRRHAAKVAKFYAIKHGGHRVSLAAVGRVLYSLALRKLDRASGSGGVSRALPLLLQAGCLDDNRALHMASVLYSTGLGFKKHLSKAWLLAMLGAQRDDRLALLHLGHLHHQGRQGLPKDPDLAYAYYVNIATQTTKDNQNPTPDQTFVEAVYLNNEDILNRQTNENHHIFHWLKLQARRGAAEAEQTIARMLFWGQQGVSPNIEKAVRHYKRGAIREDPVSMYDYGIVLLQGQGVKKDVPKAVIFLKKATEQGFAPAMNALAWYYEQFERDYGRAAQLWEQADLLQNPDAAFNLGVLYSQGLYPGKAADPYVAYKYFLKSAQRGHLKGGLLLAEIWTTGLPGHVDRRASDAVLWVKWVAEHNGYLGTVLRKALDSYLKRDMFDSLLYYLMAAEAGYAAAQFNVAYLCEQNTGRFVDPAFASRCMWEYYNLTLQSQSPNTYALIRMGDLWYQGQEGRRKDLFSAAEVYKLAALRKDPQGWYNLGRLVEEGYKLPLSVLTDLGLSELYLAENSVLQSALYKRCRDSGDTDSYLPCSLALLNVNLQSFQRNYSAGIKLSIAVAVVAAPTVLFIALGLQRRRTLSPPEP